MEEDFTVTVRHDTGHWWINEPDKLVMERVYREYVSEEATDLVLASEGWERAGKAFRGMIPHCEVFRIRRVS